MSTKLANKVPPRLLFLGTRGLFSRVVLEGLLAQGKTLVGFLVAGGASSAPTPLLAPAPVPSDLPMLPSFVEQSAVELGWQHGLPIWQGGSSGDATLDLVRALAPDAIVVACWPTRLPDALLALPRWGVLNVHPSLLPAYRGPAPLFWQLRDGLHTSGVTIHQMSARLDEGPLLAQAPFRLPSGASGEQLDRLAAQLGGQLLGRVLDHLERGRLEPRPQPAGGSYQGWPNEADFVVPPTWSARRAWNFMRATEEWGIPFTIPVPGGPLVVTRALAVAPRAALRQPIAHRGDQVAVQFSPGILLVPAEAHHREHREHRGKS